MTLDECRKILYYKCCTVQLDENIDNCSYPYDNSLYHNLLMDVMYKKNRKKIPE